MEVVGAGKEQIQAANLGETDANAERRAVMKRVTVATRDLVAAAARCANAGAFGPEDRRALTFLLKSRRAAEAEGVDALRALEGRYLKRAEELDALAVDCGRQDSTRLHPHRLTDTQKAPVAAKFDFICDAEAAGAVTPEMLEQHGIQSARTGRHYLRQYREYGMAGLVDGRQLRAVRNRPILTKEVEKVILDVWLDKRSANMKLVTRLTRELCMSRGLPLPGYHSVRNVIKLRLRGDRMLRDGKFDAYRKQMIPVVRYDLARKANERFQLDHKELDVWGKELDDNGNWGPFRLWMTAAIDEYSRTIAGFVVSSVCPDAATIAYMLSHAILPKRDPRWPNQGVPSVIQTDNGKDFVSRDISVSCAHLDIRLERSKPYYPNTNAKIERFWRSLKGDCLAALPGNKAEGMSEGSGRARLKSLLTLAEIRDAIERWIIEVYHHRRHSELGTAPVDVWRQSVGTPKPPDSLFALQAALLKSDVRTVRNDGIRLDTRRYWSPTLPPIGTKVYVLYDQDDLESVLVLEEGTNRIITEAHRMGSEDSPFDINDVKLARAEDRRGLLERVGGRKDLVAKIGRSHRTTRPTQVAGRRAMGAVPAPAAPAPSAPTSDLYRKIEDSLRGDATDEWQVDEI